MGNSAQVAPDTWHIINDQDVVAKAPKFLILYKRAGHRVVINKMGDMIVRPSFIEITMRNGSASRSISLMHLLQGTEQILDTSLKHPCLLCIF